MSDRIFKFIETNKKYVIELTKRLVSIPTVNPPGENYERIVAFLERICKEICLETKKIIIPKSELKKYGVTNGSKRISLIARWDTGAEKTLHINGHYDVVPATENWTYKPFKPVIKENRLFGRGSEDMKATIASYIFAVKAIKQLGIKPNVNLEFSFTPDEETGGKTGLEWLIKNNFIKPDFAIGEGFGGDFISCGNKGMVWFEVEVLGKSAHASQPYKGINSFEKLHRVASELLKLKAVLKKRKTRFGVKDKRDSSPSIVLGGVLSGGKKINIVPDKSTLTIDRRLIPEEDLETAKKEILEIFERLRKSDKDLRLKAMVITSEKSVIVDENEPLCRALAYAIKRVFKRKARFAIMPGGTDMRFFIKRNIPAVGYSVLGDDRPHADDEFVYIDSLINTTKVFATFFMELK